MRLSIEELERLQHHTKNSPLALKINQFLITYEQLMADVEFGIQEPQHQMELPMPDLNLKPCHQQELI